MPGEYIERFESFSLIISQIQKNILRLKSLEMREFGLQGPDVMCLFYLSRHEKGLTAAELCRHMSVDKAAISRVLAALAEGGYIQYTSQPDSRRYRTRALLTDQGAVVAEQVDKRIQALVSHIGNRITQDERELLYRSLQIVLDDLDALLRAESAGSQPRC